MFSLFKKAKSPPKSPDFNPIELLWNDLKQFIREKYCRNTEELISAVQEYESLLNCRKVWK